MNPAMGAGSRTRRFRRHEKVEGEGEQGRGHESSGFLPEAPGAAVRPSVGAPAISGMHGVLVNATASFAAPAAEEALSRAIAARPRKDVIERIKSNTKTQRGAARPLTEPRVFGEYDKPNETADSRPRALDPETLQDMVAVPHEDATAQGDETFHATPPTRAFAVQQARPGVPQVRRLGALKRAPDMVLRPSAVPPEPAPASEAAAAAAPREASARDRTSLLAMAVVVTLLVALLGGVVAMIATGA